MAVTNEKWAAGSLAALLRTIPGVDGKNAEEQVNEAIDDTEVQINTYLSKMDKWNKELETAINYINQATISLGNFNTGVDDLINSALQTGVYAHLIGISGRVTSNSTFVSEVQQYLNDTSDPNCPKFTGESARVGGGILVIGGSNPAELEVMWQKLGSLFPLVKNAIGQQWEYVKDIKSDVVEAFEGLMANFENTIKSFKSLGLVFSKKALSELFEGYEPIQNENPYKWYASRLTDLMPILDPDKQGSIGEMLKNVSNSANAALLSPVNAASNLVSAMQALQQQIEAAQVLLVSLNANASDFIRDALQTGFYMHWLGSDGSLRNNNDFGQAVADCFSDRTDINRPRFQGDMALMGGIVLMFGAPTVGDLKKKWDLVRKVFKL